MNFLFFLTFALTLFQPPVMIYRFAVLQDKSIRGSLGEKRIADYCRKVTFVWLAFFLFNGSAAAFTIFYGSDALWSLYNGGVSYILIGVLFAVEFFVRKKVNKNIPKAVQLTAITKKSRDVKTVLCYEGAWEDGKYKTWGDFLEGTAVLRRHIQSGELADNERWLLYCEDCWLFLLSFTALLQCKKQILLSANISSEYIAEIRENNSIPFLTDKIMADSFHIPALLEKTAGDADADEELPPINGNETSIIMFTSGSTGKPKKVEQRLTEFENDNSFVLSKWGEEFLCRRLCSTVSQHHIYGLLFSILLPFTAGVPFRNKHIQVPEEFEKLTDTKYMIITTPAFLKRAVEIEMTETLRLVSPWIFTSGGALQFETAEKTDKVFGFWPVEVYGSTETSGVAWRQSRNGLEWTAFDNACLSLNSEGCLVVRSPYIKDKNGFETQDMAEFLDDGRFRLLGRIDSVVKIEEKRISLTEIENRIMQSGLAYNVCVIKREGRRQYLAAAVVFNDKGKEKFAGLVKHEINKFWREYLLQYFDNLVIPKKWRYPSLLPMDTQGKIKRDDIKSLFQNPSGNEKYDFERITEKTENSVTLEFSVPKTSPYFDGHFPGFSILPAVAQIELVVRFSAEYFGTAVTLAEIKRVKFTNIIQPSAPLVLRLEKSDKSISFKIFSKDAQNGGKVYSAGTIIFTKESVK